MLVPTQIVILSIILSQFLATRLILTVMLSLMLLPLSLFKLSGTPLISGVVANDAVYKSSGEGEFLTIIQNVRLGSVDDNDFSAI